MISISYLHDLHHIHGIYINFSMFLLIFTFRAKIKTKTQTIIPENKKNLPESLGKGGFRKAFGTRFFYNIA